MQRPSNLIIGFIIAIAATFLTWIGWLIFANVIQSPEEDFESQLKEGDYLSATSELKIASQVNSNK